MLKMKLKDGAVREVAEGTTIAEFVKNVSNSLAKKVLAAKLDGKTVDLMTPLTQDASIAFLTFEDEDGRWALRHTASHILAQALKRLYKDENVKLAIGPAIDNGFYYDIDMDRQLGEGDLADIEKEMKKIVKENLKLERKEVSRQDALDFFEKAGETYKVELINDLPEGEDITLYTQGEFTDLCAGPHVVSTGKVKALKLMSVAGAYWRGDEHNKMLQRIYGTAFEKQADLDAYLHMLEEAKKRDHRKLGKEMELFTFSQNVGQGLPLWLPKGAMLRNRLQDMLSKIQRKYGYLPVITPHIGNKTLYVTSGHYAKYGKDSFQPIHTPEEGEEYLLKPMNCPHHCEIFRSSPRSYKDLPLRYAEFGTVYRYEQSGELHGLTRVRSFTQDDAHLFCTPEQLKQEFLAVMDIINFVFKTFGFEYEAQISLRDPNHKEKYVGTDEVWEKAQQAIIEACEEKGLQAAQVEGEAAFYGPKLDFMVKDALGRRWQLGTIQVDYNLPERFGLEYTGSDNQKHRPVMIHRAPFGSMERFVAVLLEHTAGHLPLWLASDQCVVLPISEKYNEYAQHVVDVLDEQGVRAAIDVRNEKIGRKIRDNELKRIPYLLIVGEKEAANEEVSVRKQGEGDKGSEKILTFAAEINAKVAEQTDFAAVLKKK